MKSNTSKFALTRAPTQLAQSLKLLVRCISQALKEASIDRLPGDSTQLWLV